jgi:high affinity Mn2+ porin
MLVLSGFARAYADGVNDAAPSEAEKWAVHGQLISVWQYHPAFRSPYRGANSLDPGSRGNESIDATLFLGARLWDGAEAWFNGEVDQGFGLSNTLGVAGFPSGVATKVGSSAPYLKLPRLFLRQTINLGGGTEDIAPDLNQLGGSRQADRIVITIGKLAVPDVFDTNKYAHDSRSDFMNWALIDAGTFDYAGNAWGYTEGAAAEWYQDWWTARLGYFSLSDEPNSTRIERTFLKQFQVIAELEERHKIYGEEGAVRLLGFFGHGRMGLFREAIALSLATGQPADTALVRHLHEKAGIVIDIEQQVTDDLGLFVRAGVSDPSREPFDYLDSDATASTGVSLAGSSWMRPDDDLGVAFVVDGISRQHAAYLNHGGLGILVGDGKLPHPGDEFIAETYYSYSPYTWLKLSADYQFVVNPAYNSDRGPVSILGLRLDAQS